MELYKIIQQKREDILEIAERHGAYNVRIFGSVVKGDDDENSDIDFLVDVGENRSFFFPGGLLLELEELLGRKVDIVTEKGLKQRMKKRILKEVVPL
jgi:hypothetical protein